jgi:hypothetical protein
VSDPTNREPESPWAQRGFLFSAVVVGVLVAAVPVLLWARGGDPAPTGAAVERSADAADAPRPSGPSPRESVCGLTAGGQGIPAIAPDVEWELVGRIAAPVSAEFGPGVNTPRQRSCFARSPTGAVFAATNLIAFSSTARANPDAFRDLTADTPARDEAFARDPGGRSETSGQILGYRVVAYSERGTTVEIAMRITVGELTDLAYLVLPMRWEKGDWKIVIQSGELPYSGGLLETLSGYVPWSAT